MTPKLITKIRSRLTYLKIKKKVLQSKLFDEVFYLKKNPDVRYAGMAPLRHFLKYGGLEGRDPSEKFYSEYYLETYPDVKNSSMNPLVHYLLFGKAEGRSPAPGDEMWREKVQEQDLKTRSREFRQQHTCDFAPMFLIVAETTIPQCTNYRLDQKKEMFEKQGYTCTVVDWHNKPAALYHLQTHRVVIFYRVPATRDTLGILEEAKMLGVTCYFELDDLIFDELHYRANPNLINLDKKTLAGLMEGARAYRKMLVACQNSIASTPHLSGLMKEVGAGEAVVIENGIDRNTMKIASSIQRRRKDQRIRIIYGSGTNTHDSDFEEALPALEMILKKYGIVDLMLVGQITVPHQLHKFGHRILKSPLVPFASYMNILAEADISITPLKAAIFNEAKSNIKYLEASILGIPSVCSPRKAFQNSVTHGVNGFLAASENDWMQVLTQLVEDKDLRKKTGILARKYVIKHYATEAITQRQISPFCRKHAPCRSEAIRIMTVNVFFSPNSHGGATIVAENLVRYFKDRKDIVPSVFTTSFEDEISYRDFVRTTFENIPVFRTRISRAELDHSVYLHPDLHTKFESALKAFQPDVIHFHALQGLGAGLANICRNKKIPYIITLHDAWWLCEKLFRTDKSKFFCGQEKIELQVCSRCTGKPEFTQQRFYFLKDILNHASLLLAPSEYQKIFYMSNGINGRTLKVNRNGIKLPDNPKPNMIRNGQLVFGFIGGSEISKGFRLVRKAFEACRHSSWELIFVSSTKNGGNIDKELTEMKGRGKITILPAYDPQHVDTFFDRINVLLFPSQAPESFGLVVREALARNKWVIATRGGGVSGAIEESVNGNLIPLDPNPSYLQKAIEDLLRDPNRLDGWENPHIENIRNIKEQAEEFISLLKDYVIKK